MVRYKRKGIGGKILIAILALLGLLFIIDKLAGTDILQTLWDSFISFIRWIADAIKSLGG